MKVEFRFEGGEELAANLATLPTRVSKRFFREALAEGGALIQTRASALAPRGDPEAPNLSESIAVMTARATGGDPVGVAIGPTKNVFYGSFQELGTKHHAAQPFLRPALDGEAQRALGVIGAALWRELAGRGIQRTVSVPTMPSGPGPLV